MTFLSFKRLVNGYVSAEAYWKLSQTSLKEPLAKGVNGLQQLTSLARREAATRGVF